MSTPCCITQPPSDPTKDKDLYPEHRKTWRKPYMIDLNTLTTEEMWLKKLDGISGEALGAMLRALAIKRIAGRMETQGM